MSEIAKVGVEQAINGVEQTTKLAITALDVGTGTAVDAVQTLVGMAQDTTENAGDLAAATLKEIEEERQDLIARIEGFSQRTTERLNRVMTNAADAIPVG